LKPNLRWNDALEFLVNTWKKSEIIKFFINLFIKDGLDVKSEELRGSTLVEEECRILSSSWMGGVLIVFT